MESAAGEVLLERVRTGGFEDFAAFGGEIDEAILCATDDHELGLLHLARALSMQGSGDATPSARAAQAALDHLRRTNDHARRCFAASVTAVFLDQTGAIAEAMEVALEALTLIVDLDVEDVYTNRARHAISGFFFRYSSFELAADLAIASLDAMDGGIPVHELLVYTIGYMAVEALHSTTDESTRAERGELAGRAVSWLLDPENRTPATEFLADGLLAEVELAIGGDVGEFDFDDSDAMYASLPPDVVAWHRMVRGAVLARIGDNDAAIDQLDLAIPGLIASSDTHCLLRAYRVRSEACAAAGDFAGAYADAMTRGDMARTLQLEQVSLFANQLRSHVELERRSERLAVHAERLEANIERDVLTGVYSRHWLHDRLTDWHSPSLFGSIAMLDVDNFKRVNDTFGHSIGDEVLVRFGAIVQRVAGSHHDVARFGGEEFVVLIDDPSPEYALDLCERIRSEVAAHDWGSIVEGLSLTVSIGVATGASSERVGLLREADGCLLRAKRDGRNRVEAAAGQSPDDSPHEVLSF